jgi:hypothetical protein
MNDGDRPRYSERLADNLAWWIIGLLLIFMGSIWETFK